MAGTSERNACTESIFLNRVSVSRNDDAALQRKSTKEKTDPANLDNETEMIQRYAPLVRGVVARVQMTLPPHTDPDELYSAGLLGLLDAIRHYEPSLGAFESYARLRIRGMILDELRRMDWVPRSVHRKAKVVEAAIQNITQRNGMPPSESAIASELGLSLDEYNQLLDEIRPVSFVCLDAVAHPQSDGAMSQAEMLADPDQDSPFDAIERKEMASLLATIIKRLPIAQQKVLALYYYEDLRLKEIAQVLGVTESRICQLHTQAILTMKSLVHREMMMR